MSYVECENWCNLFVIKFNFKLNYIFYVIIFFYLYFIFCKFWINIFVVEVYDLMLIVEV